MKPISTKKHKMKFLVRSINLKCQAIDDADGKTVAFVTPQGYVDWLLRSPLEPGERLAEIDKERHLGNVRGLMFRLHLPHFSDQMTGVSVEVSQSSDRVIVVGLSVSGDGRLRGECRAELGIDAATGRYAWQMETKLSCAGAEPVVLPMVEYNNILPARVGGRFLWEQQKAFNCTLVEDRDGAVWEFPHQHTMHYKRHIDLLRSAVGGWGGFFGEEFNPVVSVEASTGDPVWAICDAYYDFHCQSRQTQPLVPGTEWAWRYRLHWLDAAQAKPLQEKARRVTVTDEDLKLHCGARLALGLNDFRGPARIDAADEASAFIPDGQSRFWETSGGPSGNGLVRLASNQASETVWLARDASQIPPSSRLKIRGLMRVAGEGNLYFRLRPHVFHWQPQPHLEWLPVVASRPLGDTAGEWVEFTLPDFVRTPQERDTEIKFELVLDGPGTGELAELNVELSPCPIPNQTPPVKS
jgi:hypothetical protein